MRRRLVLGLACLVVAACALAGAPPEIEVQGLYEGPAGDSKIEARVVAQGKNVYRVYVLETLPSGKVAKTTLDGKFEGAAVTFAAKIEKTEWKASWANGVVKGTCSVPGGLEPKSFELKRSERKSPTLGMKPPEGAIVLLHGEKLDEMARGGGQPWYVGDMTKDGWAVWEVPIRTIVAKNPKDWPSAEKAIPEGWELTKMRRRVDTVLGIGEDGSLQVPRGGMNSKRQFEGSFKLHVELRCPFRPDARSQGRGNSGCYLPNGQEIQVLDSFGMDTYKGGCAGGLYGFKNPDTMETFPATPGGKEITFTLASLPPMQWQTYDIEYIVPMVGGKPKGKPRLTVLHNGIKIHDNVELNRDARKGGFHFQDHGNPVRYRNIWVLPLQAK